MKVSVRTLSDVAEFVFGERDLNGEQPAGRVELKVGFAESYCSDRSAVCHMRYTLAAGVSNLCNLVLPGQKLADQSALRHDPNMDTRRCSLNSSCAHRPPDCVCTSAARTFTSICFLRPYQKNQNNEHLHGLYTIHLH